MIKNNQKGFTLIELMIVIGIVALLAAVALPAYESYSIRARVSEPLALLGEAKTSMTEYYVTNGTLPPNAQAAGIRTIVGTTLVSTLSIDTTSGDILVTLTGHSSLGAAAGTSIKFSNMGTASGTIVYACVPGTITPKYLPSTCNA
jgi:type IV pilus assembly protein PilA